MSDVGDIAGFGFLRTAEGGNLIIPAPVKVTGYGVVDGDLFVGTDAAITGDIIAGGGITMHSADGSDDEKSAHYFSVHIADLSAVDHVGLIVPPFDGWVRKTSVVVWDVVAAGASADFGVVTLAQVEAPSWSITITIPGAAVEGDVASETVEHPAQRHFSSGDTLLVSVSDAVADAVSATLVLMVYRAWE